MSFLNRKFVRKGSLVYEGYLFYNELRTIFLDGRQYRIETRANIFSAKIGVVDSIEYV